MLYSVGRPWGRAHTQRRDQNWTPLDKLLVGLPCAAEDQRLLELVREHGTASWTIIAASMHTNRPAKACRLR